MWLQLGLIADADALYLECGRYDLLNALYQASGCWSKALEVARPTMFIRIMLTMLSMIDWTMHSWRWRCGGDI